jgi:MSHA pilin protein MshD
MCMTRFNHRGFTLIELILFIVVVSVGLTGILLVMNTVVKSSADPLVRKQTIAVAESLLEEILLKDYSNPADGYTGAASANRALFDDVGDYAGYSTSAGVVDILGAPVTGLEVYNISPPVVVALTADLAGVSAQKITVSVSGPAGTISLSGYRGNY